MGPVEALEPLGLGEGDVLPPALERKLEELLSQWKGVRRALQDSPEMVDGLIVEAVLPEDVRLGERGLDRIRSERLFRRLRNIPFGSKYLSLPDVLDHD